jgi:hypothetical protein
MPIGNEVLLDAGQIQETFIYRIDFLPGAELAQRCHEAIAHIGVQLVVGGKGNRTYFSGLLFHLKPWACHSYSQLLGFPALGNDTAIIVGENDYG